MIGYRGSNQAIYTATETSLSIAIPAAAHVDDLAVVTLVGSLIGETNTMISTGWTQHANDDGSATSSSISAAVWTKKLTWSDLGTNVDLTSGSGLGYKRNLDITVYSGSSVGNFVHAYEPVVQTTHTTSAVTTAAAGAWIVNVVGDRAGPGSSAFTLPAGYTQRAFYQQTGGGAVSSVVADDDNVGTGSHGAGTYTGTVSTRNAVMITLGMEPAGLTAFAGPDQSVNSLDPVSLSGYGNGGVSTSYTYSWVQTAGTPTVTITDANTATPSFTAPSTGGGTTLTFEMTVGDGATTATDTVVVVVGAAPGGSFFTEDFEGGTDGSAVTTANTNFDLVAGTTTFDDDFTKGVYGLSGMHDTTATPTALENRYSMAATETFWARWYINISALPSNATYVAGLVDNATTIGTVRLNTDGTLTIRDGLIAVATSTTSLVPQKLYRLVWHYDSDADTQSLDIYAGLNVHGTIPDETITGAFTNSVPPNRFRVGILANPPTSYITWTDSVALNYTTDPGPASPTRPVVDAGLDQTGIKPGEIVDLSGQVAAGVTPYTYAWTQVSGSPTVTIDNSTSLTTASFLAPGLTAATTLTFRLTVTDDNSQQGIDELTVGILPSTDWAAVGGSWVPRIRRHEVGGDWDIFKN